MYPHILRPEEPYGLVLTFLNTLEIERGELVDTINGPRELREWLTKAGLIHDERSRGWLECAPVLREILLEAHALREDLVRLVEAFSLRETISGSALFGLNRVLGVTRASVSLVITPEKTTLARHDWASAPLSVLAPIALDAVHLLTNTDPTRTRRCAAPQCIRWFEDTSKGGRRRWCSMQTCGNRAKAAKHRRRLSSNA